MAEVPVVDVTSLCGSHMETDNDLSKNSDKNSNEKDPIETAESILK